MAAIHYSVSYNVINVRDSNILGCGVGERIFYLDPDNAITSLYKLAPVATIVGDVHQELKPQYPEGIIAIQVTAINSAWKID